MEDSELGSKNRDREKSERQQGIQSDDRMTSLFGEPRRLNPSEGDAEITAVLGEYNDAWNHMNSSTLGIYSTNASNSLDNSLSSYDSVNPAALSSPAASNKRPSNSIGEQSPPLKKDRRIITEMSIAATPHALMSEAIQLPLPLAPLADTTTGPPPLDIITVMPLHRLMSTPPKASTLSPLKTEENHLLEKQDS